MGQCEVVQNWGDALKQNVAFNIALFNEDLLQSIYKEVVDKAQIQSLNEVSSLSSSISLLYSHACISPLSLPIMLLLDNLSPCYYPLKFFHNALPHYVEMAMLLL